VHADGQESDPSVKQSDKMTMKRVVLVSIMFLCFTRKFLRLGVVAIQTKEKNKSKEISTNRTFLCIPKQELRPQLQFFFK
jgi:hypothetical protein